MKKVGFIFLFMFVSSVVRAQQTDEFSLNEAVEYGLIHNLQIRKAENEILKARKKVWETTAAGLPQIKASASWQKFIDKPVNLMPARIFNPQAPPDAYIPVSFGTEQNMKWSMNVNQLVFSGSYITGLYSSRVYKQISQLASVKTRQKVKETVAEAYVNALMARKSADILRLNIKAVEENLRQTRSLYENGFVEQTDVKQLEITLSDLKSKLRYTLFLQSVARQMLNFAMGRNPDAPLRLRDSLENLAAASVDVGLAARPFTVDNHVDYLMEKNKVKSRKLMWRFEQSKLLPTVGAFYSLGKNAYNNEFDFFNESQNWFKQSFVGVSINIPLFSSWMTRNKIGQARLSYENARLDMENTYRQLQIQYKKLKNDYLHAIDLYRTASKNLELAREIEKKEEIKYKEGVGNSFQWNMARMQYYNAQQQYVKAMGDLILNKIKLENFMHHEE